MLILGIESSCDETAAAVVRDGREILSSVIASQIDLHRPWGGVVPELASREHLEKIEPTVIEALDRAQMTLEDIDAIAVTQGPGLIGSLLVGVCYAKSLAWSRNIPFVGVNHIEGHVYSVALENPPVEYPALALIVSGGHTNIFHVPSEGQYKVVSRTRDDAAGEAFDKVAKMLSLPYPGGPEIDKRAHHGNRRAFDFPRSMLREGHDFSFSGLKTSVLYLLPKVNIADETVLNDVCASFQEAVVDVLVEKAIAAAGERLLKLVAVSGGVSCNSRLRARLAERCAEEGLRLLLAEPRYTTDNAAMIAFAAVQRWKAGFTTPLDTDVDPNLDLTQTQAG